MKLQMNDSQSAWYNTPWIALAHDSPNNILFLWLFEEELPTIKSVVHTI